MYFYVYAFEYICRFVYSAQNYDYDVNNFSHNILENTFKSLCIK